MSNVIAFPSPGHVEIYGGLVTSSTVAGADGIRSLPAEIGSRMFFVDVVEPDGGRIGMWSGKSYDQARREAAGLSEHFGRVRDLVGGA